MKQLTKITDKGSYLVEDKNRLLFTGLQKDRPLFFSYNPTEGVRSVEELEFSRAIAGDYFGRIQEQLKRPIYEFSSAVGQNGDRYFCFYQKGVIYGFDKDGNQKYEWEPELGQGHAIYDIKFQAPNSMWLAFPTGQTVTKVSLESKKEEFRIGEYTYDEVYEPLSFPESLFIAEDYLFISSMGNGSLYRVNLLDHKIDLIDTFDDKLWEYIQVEGKEYVRLDTGIYMIHQ